jgi:dTDP-4-amino-4,6-dideoxygalactose transaminase
MKNYNYVVRCNLNNSNNIMNNGIGLGLHQAMEKSDIEFICQKLNDIILELTK